MIRDKTTGCLYGTALIGGRSDACDYIGCAHGCGTVFQITSFGKESVLYGFRGQRDGALHADNLLLRGDYVLGTAFLGGKQNCDLEGGCGTVFGIRIK